MKGIEKEENEIKESKKKNNEKKIENIDNKKEEIGIYKKDNSTLEEDFFVRSDFYSGRCSISFERHH